MLVDCRSCKSWGQQWCCEGCDYPREKPWKGSCLHYQKNPSGIRVEYRDVSKESE